MRVFLDTEFVNRGAGHPIDLISIGMVNEVGEEFYGINVDAPLGLMAANRWIRENLWSTLPLSSYEGGIIEWDAQHPDIPNVRRYEGLREDVYQFLIAHGEPEIWGSYSGFDYVLLSQLFGTFDDYRPSLPMLIHDLQQEFGRYRGWAGRPRQTGTAHHALDDARHVKLLHDWARTVVP